MKNDVQNSYRLTPFSWDSQYIDEMYKCFCNMFFISAILNASALVESILFWEYVRVTPEQRKVGANLPDRVTLSKLVHDLRGVVEEPIKELVDGDETEVSNGKPRFIDIRNKFAHGALFTAAISPSSYLPRSDVAGKYGVVEEEYFSAPIGGYENIAYIQVFKSLKFVKKYIEYIEKKYPPKPSAVF